MGILLEITIVVLAILSWKKGWKQQALIPPGVYMGLCMFMGIVVGACSGTSKTVLHSSPLGFIIFLLAIITIIVQAIMLSKAPDSKPKNSSCQQ